MRLDFGFNPNENKANNSEVPICQICNKKWLKAKNTELSGGYLDISEIVAECSC